MSAENRAVNTRILKSTTVIGGSSLVNVLVKVMEGKIIALLVGPGGVGVMGLFNSAVTLASTVGGMGISTSGVPRIAEAIANGDEQETARRVFVFRRLTFLLSGSGAILFFLMRRQISQITFGNQDYVRALGLLALVPFFMVISGSQSGLIRAYRRIGDLAIVAILGVGLGTILGVPALVLWGEAGIAPYLTIIAGFALLVTWWYARKLPVASVALSWSQILHDSRPLLSLGLVFMSSGVVTLASAYLVKVLVTRQFGLGATGLFQASSTLSNVYVGFILGAMGADFLPHLASLSGDDSRSSELINTQMIVGMLLAGPGLLAILVLGPWVLALLYSSEFTLAFAILRWQVLGTFLRVVTWPIGYLMVARGNGRLFFATEFSTNAVYVAAASLLLQVENVGVAAVGIAFLLMYIFLSSLTMLIARRLIGFRWSYEATRIFLLLAAGALAVFVLSYFPRTIVTTGIGLLIGATIGLYSLRKLVLIIGWDVIQSYRRNVSSDVTETRQ